MSNFPFDIEIATAAGWQQVTDRLRGDEVVIDRGQGDENTGPVPARTTLLLDNSDGALTPGNPTSPYYPAIGRKMPVRITRPGGIPHLLTDGATGNEITTPDHASLDITGSIWLAGEVSLNDWHDFDQSGSEQTIIEKWGTAGNRSYRLVVNAGALYFMWSNDGTAENFTAINFAPVTSDGRMAVGCWWVPDNGAGVTETHFYTAPRLDGPWTDLDPDFDDGFAGTSTIFSSSSIVRAGRVDGRLWAAEIRSGAITGPGTGTLVASPDCTAQAAGASSFVDSTGKTWTVAGDATIDDTEVRFQGRVDSLKMSWPLSRERGSTRPQAARVEIEASVALRRMLQGRKPLDSTLRRHITSPEVADLVIDYWPHEDGRDSRTIASAVPGGRPLQIRGDYSFAADDTLDASSPLLSVSSGRNAYMSAPIQRVPQVPGGKWEVTRFFRIDEPVASPAATQLLAVDTNGTVKTWRITINDTQIGIGGQDAEDPPGSVVLASLAFDDRFVDTWAMIVLEVTDDGVNVDWEVSIIPIPLGAIFATSGTFVGSPGAPKSFRNSLTGPPEGVSVGHLIVTFGADIGWLAGADTAWTNETAAHRFRRLMREERLPHAIIGDPAVDLEFRGNAALSSLMGAQRPLPLLDLVEACVITDGGRLSELKSANGLVLRTRQSLYNQADAVTLVATQSQLRREPFRPTLDDQGYRNIIEATRPDGSSATAVIDPEPEPGDIYDDTVEVNVATDLQLPDHASWRLHVASTETLRYPGLATSLGRAGAAVAAAWDAADIGDRVAISTLMDQMPAEDDAVLLEGSTERLDFFRWIVELNASPAGPWEVGVRDDDTRGKRDTAGSELSTGIDDDDTSLSVATTLGPLWSDDAAEDPFDIDIGGEQITVTNVTGTSSPQTFAVTRSVNGVVKSHATGAPVRLWRPTIRAL